jgi:hypothetical protein
LDYLDAVEHGEQSSGTLALSMPMIDSQIASMERDLERERTELAPMVYRAFMKTVRESKRAAGALIKDLEWLAKRLLETGEQENYIVTALDSVLSVEVNRILGKVSNSPRIENRKEFTQHVLGVPERDLLHLGFDTDDGRGVSAYVPIEFLLGLPHLIDIGEEFGAADPTATLRHRVIIACQRVRDFDLAFSFYEKRALWYRFVLPYSLREGRERVIDDPGDVERFGFA